MSRPTILFDGVCHLCNGFVRFVLARDGGRFDFAPLQSELARRTLGERGAESLVLIEGDRLYFADKAALRILSRLRLPWPWVARSLAWLPDVLLAWGYRTIARHRYAWFGKDDVCALPRPEWRGRFLE